MFRVSSDDAIKIIQKWLDNAYEDVHGEMLAYIEGWFYDEDRQAFEMAIRALQGCQSPENPCENCQEFDCYGCGYKGDKYD